jgi:hypothetical protein
MKDDTQQICPKLLNGSFMWTPTQARMFKDFAARIEYGCRPESIQREIDIIAKINK